MHRQPAADSEVTLQTQGDVNSAEVTWIQASMTQVC